MDVISHADAAIFAEAVRPVIERQPARCNILATVLDQSVHGTPWPQASWLLLTEGGQPVGAAIRTPPYNLLLTPLPEGSRATAAGLLADVMYASGANLPGVTGPTADAEAFAEAWQQRTDLGRRLNVAERLYQIDTPPAGPAVAGAARQVGEGDVELVASWLTAFNLEAFPERERIDAVAAVRLRLRRGWYLIWEDDGVPVSLAGLSRGIAGVSRIGPVYTPGFHRGRGYGSAVTAAATRLGLEQGSGACILYTHLSNPTSNAIYRALGYRPIDDGAEITFA